MSTHQFRPPPMPPGPPGIPPTQPGAYIPPEQPSSWPKVIGIICVVLGGLGILGAASSALGPAISNFFASMMPDDQANVMEVTKEYQPWTMIIALLQGILAVLLLAGGIGLLQRRRWGIAVSMVWAVLRMLLVVASAILSYDVVIKTIEAMSQQSGAPALSDEFAEVVAIVGAVFTLLWGWALPVFLLIWFTRGRIKAETAAWA